MVSKRELEEVLQSFRAESGDELEDNYYALHGVWIESDRSQQTLIIRLSHMDLGEVGRRFLIPRLNTAPELRAWLKDVLIWITEIQESPTRRVDMVPRDQAGVYWPDDDIP